MNIDRLFIMGESDSDFVSIDEEYGFYLKWRKLSAATVKTNYDDTPGANSSIDGTEDLGDVFFEDRDLLLDCVFPHAAWHEPYQRISSKYHGQRVKILFSNDPDYYWTGRLFVSEYDAKAHSLSMHARVFPYKFKRIESVFEATVSETATVTLQNSRMRVVPIITIDAPITLSWNGVTKSIAVSEYPATLRIEGFELPQNSETVVTILGDANVSIRYREGEL